MTRAVPTLTALVLGTACASSPVVAPTRECAVTQTELYLPFPAGQTRLVLQGNGGGASHTGWDQYAWDFDLAEGAPVVAAAPGTVVEVVDRFERGAWDGTLTHAANLVVVDHGDNLFSVYQHLAAHSARVHVGQAVGRGQELATSGNTGKSRRPHLHFEVVDHTNQSLPICFADVPGGVPATGQRYESANQPRRAVAAVSTLPRDTFAINGILLECEVPTRLLSVAELELRGRVIHATSKVAVLFSARAGGEAHHQVELAVDDAGVFSTSLTLAGLRGAHNFALARADHRGRFVSRFSVPVLVTEVDEE